MNTQATPPDQLATRILWTAFRIVKYISVAIVAACLVSITLALIGLLSVQASFKAATVPPMSAPTFAAFTAANRTQGHNIAPHPSQGNALARNTTASQTRFNADIDSIASEFLFPDTYFSDYLKSQYDSISSDDSLFQDNDVLFIAGLRDFLKQLPQHIKPNDPDSQRALANSLKWYVKEFSNNMTRIKDSTSDNAARKQQAEAQAATTRIALLGTIGGSLVTLVAFIFIPLLIQIEANTRALLSQQQRT